MIKKTMFTIITLIFALFLVACGDDPVEQTYQLPDLAGKTETEIQSVITGVPLTLLFTYEDSDTVDNGKFIRYESGAAGDEYTPGSTFTVVIAKNYPVLPDLLDLSEAEIISLLDSLDINYTFTYAINNSVEANNFSQITSNHTVGNKVPFNETVEIEIALNNPKLPDLSGKSEAEVRTALTNLRIQYRIEYKKNNEILAGLFESYKDRNVNDFVSLSEFVVVYIATNDPKLPNLTNRNEAYIIDTLNNLGIDFEIEYVLNNEIQAGRFSHYTDYASGDFIDETVVVNIAVNDPKLPDLTNMHKDQIISTLDGLGILYEFVYETNEEVLVDYFVRVDDYQINDFISSNVTLTITLATDEVIIPSLEGLNEFEIHTLLTSLGLTFSFQIETNNEVPDMTFSRFESHVAGEFVAKSEMIVIYIGFNDPKLPDFTGKSMLEISRALDELFIQYTFSYVINDEFAEDSFAYYVGYEIDDFISQGETVEVVLYENTFTKDETSLFISKYIEGDLNEQALEIYNPFDQAKDLSDYHIAIFSNGAITPTYIIELSGNLQAGETFVIVRSTASVELQGYADLVSEWLRFDGNDVIQLRYKNNTYIDSIYSIGSSIYIMQDEVFIRNEQITGGTRSFTINQWDAYIPSFVEVLGSHPYAKPTQMVMDRTLLNNTFGDPTVSGMIIVTLSYINDGDTAAFDPGFTGTARVRFLGIDTPETFPVVDPGGLEAKAYTTQRLTNATEIILQSDPVLGAVDTYGRTLGYVWVDGSLLNYDLVYNGHSQNYLGTESELIFANRYIYRWFEDAERHAIENELGIWGL